MSVQEVAKTVYIDNNDDNFWRYELIWVVYNEHALVRVYKPAFSLSQQKFMSEFETFDVKKPERKGFQTVIHTNLPMAFGESYVLNECQKHRADAND